MYRKQLENRRRMKEEKKSKELQQRKIQQTLKEIGI